MEWWDNFRQLEFSNEILIIVGALVLIIGVMRIISSGLKMLFWVILCALGMGSIAYGTNQRELSLPFNESNEIAEYVGTGKELSSDALRLLCDKLDTAEAE